MPPRSKKGSSSKGQRNPKGVQYIERSPNKSSNNTNTKRKQKHHSTTSRPPSYALLNLLRPYNLSVQRTPKDGNCLFNAIQISLSSISSFSSQTSEDPPQNPSYTYSVLDDLRTETSLYMSKNPDNFKPFFTPSVDPDNLNIIGDYEDLQDESFEGYCERLKRDGEWGGQMEIMALSCMLDREIKVFQELGEGLAQIQRIKNESHSHNLRRRSVCIWYVDDSHYEGLVWNDAESGWEDEDDNLEVLKENKKYCKECKRKIKKCKCVDEDGFSKIKIK
ncbi:hypothetical protein TrVE_jg14357 [Triparma verrucosa]|uniref:Ubiquitin thioesterase OTU n=1 Tax=Triparma verrucosa TaxID=1606542 RepID=A0A9W7CLG8_9STRA|nr:hypothetical protein TrVE_jg14357 [Triparma verrucosa]